MRECKLLDLRTIGVVAVATVSLAGLVSGCADTAISTDVFSQAGISFRYPRGWNVVGFSKSNYPPRLVVSSYHVPADTVEGDCGGWKAAERLPPKGAYVILIDYGQAAFPPRPSKLTPRDGNHANYECFGESTMFRFRVGSVSIQAHVGLGSDASDQTRDRALAVLSSLSTVDQ